MPSSSRWLYALELRQMRRYQRQCRRFAAALAAVLYHAVTTNELINCCNETWIWPLKQIQVMGD